MNKIYIMLVFVLQVLPMYAQISQPNRVTAHRINEKIKLDGMPDEPFWREAQIISNFTQRELDNGQPVTERTETAVCYDDENLYIACWCYDREPEKIVAKEMLRDFEYWVDDNYEIVFDTYLDKRNGYVFVINPNGARADVQVSDDGSGFNKEWDGVWDAEAVITEEGWFGEMVIPFSTLKFPDREKHVWGVNFERNIRRHQEQAFWQGWSRDYDFEHVSHAGYLDGLEGIEGKEALELLPYVTAGYQSNDDKTLLKAGGDVNYLLTPTLKLNLTANTDFAQVESDQAQINLTRFSLYFPEKRDFFIEGRQLFDFDMDGSSRIFYSRRIGLHDGEEVPIIAGARLTGKSGDSHIGMLSMQTARHGDMPTSNYTVARVKMDVLEGSNIGMIMTSKYDEDHYNFVYGIDGTYYTNKLFGDKRFSVSGAVAQSLTSDVRSKDNAAYRIGISYPNDELSFNTGFIGVQEQFNPEVGYIRRGDFRSLYGDMRYSPRFESIEWLRRLNFKVFNFRGWWDDDSGELQTLDMSWSPFGLETRSGESISFYYSRNFDRLPEDFNIHDTIIIHKGGYWHNNYSLSGSTFRGRNISGSAGISAGDFYGGTKLGFNAGTNMSVNEHLQLSFSYSRNMIELKGGNFNTDAVGSRIQYAFNPKINTSLYGQWNNQMDKIILNFRFNWIPMIGSDVYFVVNQMINTADWSFRAENTVVLTKFVWRLGI